MSAFKGVPAFAAIVAVMGCQGHRSNEPMTADLERDLNLASAVHAPRTGTVSAIELNSNGAPSGNSAGMRIAIPTKKRAPSPAKSPTVAEVAVAPSPAEEAPAKSATATTDAVSSGQGDASAASAEPAIYISAAPSGPSAGESDVGRGESGHRGSIIGAIIRGTTVGVDHCEPMGPGQRGTLDHGGIAGTILGGNGGTLGGMKPGTGNAGRPRY